MRERFSTYDPEWTDLQVVHAELVARRRRAVEEHRRLVAQHRERPAVEARATLVARQVDLDGLLADDARVLEEDREMERRHDRLAARREEKR